MKKVADKRITMLDALAWKAKELDVSYGELSAFVTPEEEALYYQQYSQIMQQKEDIEKQRVEELRRSKMSKGKNKKQPRE